MKNHQQPTKTKPARPIRVRERGQVTLPAAARKALRVEEGDYLEPVATDAGILLRPVALVERDRATIRAGIEEAVASLDRGEGVPLTRELMRDIREEAAERLDREKNQQP